MKNITITLNNEEIEKIVKKFNFEEIDKKPIKFTKKINNSKITIYTTNVLLIQGNDAQEVYKKLFSSKYCEQDKLLSKLCDEDGFLNSNFELEQNYSPSIGSDEVGNGDFFLGICVCATYIDNKKIKWLKSLDIKDSKKISDDQIMIIGEKLINQIPYVAINLDASEYNKLYKKINNLNAIKAYLHNKCFIDLTKKIKKPYFIVIDQFVNQSKYYEYLTNLKTKIIKIDCFSTKAENKYYAVACGAIIARYFHLKIRNEINQKYNVNIPLGSSNENIKNFGIDFINKYGLNEFNKITKNNFKTYNEIIDSYDKLNIKK